MSKFFNFIFKTLLSCLALYAMYFIWLNQEEIITLAYNTFKSEKEIEIKEANEYKRYYMFEVYNTDEDFEPQNYEDVKNIIYNFLNNGWEEFTFYCTDEYVTCVEDIKELSNDAALLSSINNYVSPFNSFSNFYTKIGTEGSITLNIKKTYTEEMVTDINTKLDKIIKSLKLDGLSETDKIKKIHNYLIKYINYDERDDYQLFESNNAYGALYNNLAICSGYSDSMSLLLDRINIPNFKVASENHVWNMVLVDNEWKHIDVTWDDPINASYGYDKYTFFLISTEKLLKLDKKEHNFEEEFYGEIKKEID